MRKPWIIFFLTISSLLAGCSTEPPQLPSLNDPEVIKYALDNSGSIYTDPASLPTRIRAVETTLRELDELDETGSYGPNNPGLDEPVFYFVFATEYRPFRHTGDSQQIKGWVHTIFERSSGRVRTGGAGPSYLEHPEMIDLKIPSDLAEIDVSNSTLFPEWGKKYPLVTPAPPATSAPQAPGT